MEQALRLAGRMLSRQCGHTGNREIFRRGSPQMRQSEGKKTEKRLSAIRRGQAPPDEAPCETMECPATATLAWLARIRSSLLLKTASSIPQTNPRGSSIV